MPPSDSQHSHPPVNPSHPDALSPPDTLFLLSVCQDEEDAAALRSDLKRSGLANYKLQRCPQLDDANHLLQVCRFDLAFLRLDDFQDRQVAIDYIRQSDPDLSLVALVSSRLLNSQEFAMPRGIDSHCRLEDLSPSVLANIVSSVIGQKRSRKEHQRLRQELRLAVEVADLGSWTLDIETGRLGLSENTAFLLGFEGAKKCLYLDDLIEKTYPDDQDEFKRIVDHAIETQGDLEAKVRLSSQGQATWTIKIKANYRPGDPTTNPTLYGYIKREEPATSQIPGRIEAANQAIKAACKELDLAMQTVKPHQKESAIPLVAQRPNDTAPESEDRLSIDKTKVLKQVLNSLNRPGLEQHPNTFPFDFSSGQQSDYSEPNPQKDGFIGAAQRLVTITQNGHEISVNLSVENDGAIESECEKELLFEILRELLTNVVKHARATECIIALFRDEDDWVLQVEDDGVGLENNLVSISTPLNKIGLFRIRTKLALKGGQLDLTPTFPKGLIARARLPVNLSSSQDAERA